MMIKRYQENPKKQHTMNVHSTLFNDLTIFPFYKETKPRNLIFIHIPKTGGTSIKKAMKFPNVDKSLHIRKHHRIDQIKPFFEPSNWEDSFKFTFVRNPWDRLYSYYRFRKRKALIKEEHISSFNQWVKFFLTINPYKGQFRSQMEWLTDETGEINLDFIGRFERLHEDYDKVCSLFNIKNELPHEENSFLNKSYKLEYSEESADIVSRYYKDDIDYFGYSFDDDF